MNNEELVDQIIVNQLESAILTLLNIGVDGDEDKRTLSSLLDVLEYFTVARVFDEFYVKHKQKIEEVLYSDQPKPDAFSVQVIKENHDGSAEVEVKYGANVSKTMMEEGVNLLLIKHILEGTTDQIFEWATRGKQEENTDRIIAQFSSVRASADSK